MLQNLVHRGGIGGWVRGVGHRFPMIRGLGLSLVNTTSLLLSTSFARGNAAFDAKRKTIILCSHDAGPSGAPILAVNLARHLSKQFNVICLMLAGGPLREEFARHCVATIAPRAGTIRDADPHVLSQRIIARAKTRYGADYLLANSVECGVAVRAARILSIPSVILIHEFAEYTHPARLTGALEAANRIIFSSNTLARSALAAVKSAFSNYVVLPQGKSEIPSYGRPDTSACTSYALRAQKPDELLCVGCGRVEMRKGVDLFIATAAKALDHGVNARFVWVGDGYKPESDMGYGIWLKDQLERSGYADRIEIIPSLPGPQLISLLRDARVMFLSSRLDPLPNVVIDALYEGVPVVCFDRATGFAEYFGSDATLKRLVVPYFDLSAAADTIRELMIDGEFRHEASERSKAVARSLFDMESYVENLKLQLECAAQEQKLKEWQDS